MKTKTNETIQDTITVLRQVDEPLPAIKLTPTRPDDTSLDTLGLHAQQAHKSGAEKAWELGRALVLAKSQTNKKEYAEWLTKWLPDLQERTRQRYEKVGVLDFDTIQGKNKHEIYQLLFGTDYATGKAKKQRASIRKRLDNLPDDNILEAAMKYDIDADPVELRAFLSDILDLLK